MDHSGFLTIVQRATGDDRDAAERAIRAVLATLADRLSKAEALDLVDELPPELGPLLFTDSPAERFDVDEFLGRVARLEGVDLPTAERHARAVFRALALAISDEAYDHLLAVLPKGYARLLPRAPLVEAPPAETILDKVAARAGVDRRTARKATDAVLETLAERIAAGETDDLMDLLPVEFHPALKRGKAVGGTQARRMPLEVFVDHVVKRADVPESEARNYARAVMRTLREVLGEEFYDITSELPREYDVLWVGDEHR